MADNIEQLLRQAEQSLAAVSDSARLDAEVLLATVLDKNRSYFIAFPEQVLNQIQHTEFQHLLAKRQNGQPIAHITGQREFWSLELDVNEHTLIPRPDTEVLIEFVLQQFPQQSLNVADLGTGSGAIAIALASEKPDWHIVATDQSGQALETAQKNANKHHCHPINFIQGSWFEALDKLPDSGRFDLIISNPPYIPEQDPHLQQGDVRFEPITALASGSDGLNDIRHLIKQAPGYLNNSGWLVLEHGYDQKQAVYQLFSQAGCKHIVQIDDYAGNPRVSAGQFSTQP